MQHIEEIYPKPSSPCNCMNIRRASRAVTQFYDKVLAPSGLTVSQFGLLRHIPVAGQVSITELAKLIRIDRTTLNRNLKPLKENTLITITPGKDPRVKEIALTESGEAAVQNGCLLWEAAQTDMREYFGEPDLRLLNQFMAKLEALAP